MKQVRTWRGELGGRPPRGRRPLGGSLAPGSGRDVTRRSAGAFSNGVHFLLGFCGFGYGYEGDVDAGDWKGYRRLGRRGSFRKAGDYLVGARAVWLRKLWYGSYAWRLGWPLVLR